MAVARPVGGESHKMDAATLTLLERSGSARADLPPQGQGLALAQPGGVIGPTLRDIARLDPDTAHGVSVRLQASLSSTTAEDTDTFDVPADFDFAIYKILGLFAFDNLTAEPFTVASYNVSPLERAFVKAQNCRVKLENAEDKFHPLDESMFMSSLLPPFGSPVEFAVPHVVGRGRSLKSTFTLIDTTGTNMVGAAVTYGLRIDGVLVRTRPRDKSSRGK